MKLFYKQWKKDINNIPNDAHVFGDNLLQFFNYDGDCYCPEINIIHKIINNDDNYFDFSKNLIDIGCEYGEYSYLLPFNYSYMFDGNKSKCIIAEFNMLLHNKENNYKCFNVLLSDNCESILYNGWNTLGCGNNILDDGYIYDEYYNQESRILDNYNLNNIGLIKIDVERMEEKNIARWNRYYYT